MLWGSSTCYEARYLPRGLWYPFHLSIYCSSQVAAMPKHHFLQPCPPAPAEGSWGSRRPGWICNPSGMFWVCPRASSHSDMPECLHGEASSRHLGHMPKPTQLAPLNAEPVQLDMLEHLSGRGGFLNELNWLILMETFTLQRGITSASDHGGWLGQR